MAMSPERRGYIEEVYRNSVSEEFLAREAQNRDCIDFKKCYVDIAGKDLQAGLLLSQIIYWFLRDKQGKTKLRVVKDDKIWLAKKRTDWWDEVRLSAMQFDRAIKVLEREGLVETKVYKFDGCPTKHIRINTEEIDDRLNSILVFDENPIQCSTEIEVSETLNSLTETTTQTTTKKKREVFQPEAKPDDQQAYADSLSPSKLGHFLMESVNRLHKTHRGRSMYSGTGSKWERDVLLSVYDNCSKRRVKAFEFLFGEWFRRWETLKCLEWAREKGQPVATVPSMSYISKNMQYLHDEVMGKAIVKYNKDKFADVGKDSAEIPETT